jgi:hypothetical protein
LPVKSTLIVNGERALRRRTSRRGRTTETRFRLADDPVAAGTARQIFLWMRGDLAAARKDYALTLVSEKPLRIRAVPLSKELAKVVAAVEIQFADDRRSVTEVVLEESAKTRTVITFAGTERDPEVPARLFEVGE